MYLTMVLLVGTHIGNQFLLFSFANSFLLDFHFKPHYTGDNSVGNRIQLTIQYPFYISFVYAFISLFIVIR